MGDPRARLTATEVREAGLADESHEACLADHELEALPLSPHLDRAGVSVTSVLRLDVTVERLHEGQLVVAAQRSQRRAQRARFSWRQRIAERDAT